jgi:two-component system, LytTR family, response regulator
MEPQYRCLIVDDETPAHEVLKAHIAQTEGLNHTASAFNGKEAMHILQHEKVDIVFLDIEMPLITGMELLKSLSTKPAVIITTAFQEFAFEAWENDAVDYLKKPISYAKFLKAVNKAKLYCSLAKHTVQPKTFSFRVDGQTVQIHVDEIMYVSSLGNYLKITTRNSKTPVVVYERLSQLLSQLDKNNFVQIHRSYVVNRAFIEKADRFQVTLKTGEQLAVGRKYQVLL